MISDLAIAEIEKLQKDGLNPTPSDIVRLNALGLKIERCRDCGDFYAMPRVSYLGKLTFREPSIAALEWIDAALLFSDKAPTSQICVYAFALSRHPDELPTIGDRSKCAAAISSFTNTELRTFTFDQINAALVYAIHGSDSVAREYPPEDESTAEFVKDPLASIGAGILIETIAVGLGISVRDISRLTVGRAKMLQEVAMRKADLHRADSLAEKSSADFYSALAEITERLKGQSKEPTNG